MKIALIGYGKMGQLVKEVALERKHEIVAIIDSKTPIQLAFEADLCIDFSHPQFLIKNLPTLAQKGKNIIVGTTGWEEHLPDVRALVAQYQIGFLYAPNFSLGVHLFFKIVEAAASLMKSFDQYEVGLFEAHHSKKSDSPSGTAKKLIAILSDQMKDKFSKTEDLSSAPFPISALRCGSIPGTHSLIFDSPVDTITLTHQARNREGFARGAVAAAEWLGDKKGFFTLQNFIEDRLNQETCS